MAVKCRSDPGLFGGYRHYDADGPYDDLPWRP